MTESTHHQTKSPHRPSSCDVSLSLLRKWGVWGGAHCALSSPIHGCCRSRPSVLSLSAALAAPQKKITLHNRYLRTDLITPPVPLTLSSLPDSPRQLLAIQDNPTMDSKHLPKVSVDYAGQQKHFERYFSALSRFETPEQEKALLFRVFATFDENGDGRIGVSEMRRSLEKLGVVMQHDVLLSAMKSASVGEDGLVDFEGFRALYRSICSEDVEKSCTPTRETVKDPALLAAFRIFDKDHDGYISASELQSVLRNLGFLEASNLANCVTMISKVDSDGDGLVSFSEFEEMMNKMVDWQH